MQFKAAKPLSHQKVQFSKPAPNRRPLIIILNKSVVALLLVVQSLAVIKTVIVRKYNNIFVTFGKTVDGEAAVQICNHIKLH